MPDLQAARGASLIASETSGPAATGEPGRRTPRPAGRADDTDDRPAGRPATALALGVGLVGLLVDLGSKQLAVRELSGRPPVEVVGSWLQLQLLRNPGAAFSAGASITPVISVVAIVAAVVVLWFSLRVRHRGWAVALGLLLAGVVGNLVDRLFRAPGPFRGHVVDFFALPNWPVFNVADVCIDAAGVLFVLLLFRGVRLDGSRHDGGRHEKPRAADGDPA